MTANAQITYVNHAASGANDGSSWASAFTDLQDALDSTMSGTVDTILIAEGTYYPTQSPDGSTTNARDRAFHLANNNVVILGGYDASTGTQTGGSTILSGDIGTAGSTADNCYHVFITTGLSSATAISKLTITAAKANGGSSSFITYASNSIFRNYGGGMYNRSSSPTLTNCLFTGNSADNGGGMYNRSSSPTLINCAFASNSADYGGGMYNISSSSPTLTNCVFTGTSAFYGGGMYNSTSTSPTLTNCVFTSNSADNGGGMYNSTSSPTLTNTLFYKNTAISGNSNITTSSLNSNSTHNASDADLSVFPNTKIDLSGKYYKDLFADSTDLDGTDDIWGTADDGLFLLPNSILRDAGTATGAPVLDIAGNTRPTPPSIGAYEYVQCAFAASVVYVDIAATGNETGTSWETALKDLSSALRFAKSCPDVQEIWVAEGTYLPTLDLDQSISFDLKSGLAIYGGFEGAETSISQRNIASHPTILSGDLGVANDFADNSYHVVISENTLNTAILDGFIVKKGSAAAAGSSTTNGGGLLGLNSKAVFQNCSFENNSAASGGGVYLANASASKFFNCTIRNNVASGNGGGVAGSQNTSSFTNCLFVNNLAFTNGGAIYNSNSGMVFQSCTIIKNIASAGNALFAVGAFPTVTNSILWNFASNSSTLISPTTGINITYSIVENGYAGVGNLDQNPLFINANTDFGLQSASPARDATLTNTFPAGILTDLAGNPRISNCTLDMGANEFQDLKGPLLVRNTEDDGCGSLRYAVTIASPGDTIRFDNVINGDTIKLSTGEIFLDKNLVIIGNDTSNTIIDAQDLSRIFHIPSTDTLVLESINLINGNGAGLQPVAGLVGTSVTYGGSILNQGVLTLKNSKISKNYATYGSGLYTNSATTTILNCKFSENKTGLNGGGIFGKNQSEITIENSIFENNNGGYHGAISIEESNATITNSIIKNNIAINYGGGISVIKGMLNVSNSSITGNGKITVSGGGISIRESYAKLAGNTISGNISAEGGGIFILDATVDIDACTIVQNDSRFPAGGILLTRINSGDSLITITNSIIANNTSGTSNEDIVKNTSTIINGGNNLIGNNISVETEFPASALVGTSAAPLDPLLGPLAFNDGTTQTHALLCGSPAYDAGTGTEADQRGKPVFGAARDIGAYESQYALDGNHLVLNTNNDGQGSLRDIISLACSGDTIRFSPSINGDTIKLVTQIVLNKDLVILGNDTTNTIFDGMANSRIFQVNTGKTVTLSDIKMQNGNKSGSNRQDAGGAIYNEGRLFVNNSILSGNSSYANGGAIFNSGYLTIASFTNCILSGNSTSFWGGGVFNDGLATLNFTNCTISGNSADIYGGGVYDTDGKITFTNSIISGNYSGSYGGAIRALSSTVRLINCTISGNSAVNSGGAIWKTGGSMTLRNSIVAKNSAATNADIYGTYSGNNNIIGGEPLFVMNVPTAPSTGGDLRLACDSQAIDAGDTTGISHLIPLTDLAGQPRYVGTIDIGAYERWANFGAIIVTSTEDSGIGSLRNAVLAACSGDTIRFDNTIDGDTIKLLSQIELDKNLVILGNDTTKTIVDGMAVTRIFQVNTGVNATIKGIKMQNGKASGTSLDNRGGAIYNLETLQVINCAFSGNTAFAGGAVYNLGAASFINSSLTGNSAPDFLGAGGGVFNDNAATISFANGTLSGNFAFTGGAVVNSGGNAIFTNSAISGNSAFSNGGGVFNSTTNATISLANCTLSGNTAVTKGGGVYNGGTAGAASFFNCILAKNLAPNDNDIFGLYNGSNNQITIDPVFVLDVPAAPSSAGDLRLQACSPAINAGTIDTTGLNLGLLDLEGNPRIFEDRIDIGAYERQIAPFIVTTSAVSAVICPGSTLNLSALAENGDEAATYTWTGPNGFTDNIQNPVVSNADSGMYVVTATSGLSTAKDSIKITYPAETSITTSPSEFNNIYSCENALTVIGLDIENAAEYTFQWQQSIGGAFTDLAESSPYSQVTNDTLEIDPTSLSMDGYQFRTLISNGCETVISDTFNLKVGATPMITLQPVSQIVCPTNEAILEVDVNGAGVSFQWQIDNGSGFVNVSGSEYYGKNSKKLIISNFDYAISGKAFRCLVFTSCFQVPSDPATITINTDVTILAQPISQTVCEFSTAIFTAQAVKLTPGILTYQWQRKSGTGVWTNINSDGRYTVNGNQLSIANAPASWNGAEFRCLMNDYCQTIPKTLNVIPVAHITQNPVNQEICVGNNAGFSVIASGEGLTYRWQVNSGSGFVNLIDGGIYQGATSANLILSFPSATVNNYQYRCVVSGTSTCDLMADTSSVASISFGIAAEAQTVFYNSPISTDDGVTQAVGYILGVNDILAPNGKAEFRAGNAIMLNPGFEVEAGAVFTAKIMNPCQTVSTSSMPSSPLPKEKVK
ncbi:hypothetical protein EGI22_04420 [Lacihabitans sp. LS3-19]|nr:hypothetical protein [Lacihabitans sp. LS3-19]